MTSDHNHPACVNDYFTYIPADCNNHFSTETPLASPTFSLTEDTASDPYHPLLAYRDIEPTLPASPKMSANLLQLQTTAAHSTAAARPAPRPTQNVLQVTSDSYGSSSDGSESSSTSVHTSSCEYARCSRCQRTPSIDVRTGQWNMIQYGLNLWYCSRCAALVGLPKR